MRNLLSINFYHYLRGGCEAVYFQHAKLFEENGWSNTFFSMKHPKNIPCDTEKYFAERVDYEAGGGLSARLIAATRVIWSLDAASKLDALLKEREINVAHFHGIYHHLSPSVLATTRRRGIINVMTAHDLKIACPSNKMFNSKGICEACKGGRVWNVLRNRCIKDSLPASATVMVESAIHKTLRIYDRYIDMLVAPSRFYEQKLVEWGWNPKKVIYIPNFIEIDSHFTSSPPGKYMLYVGRLAKEKGLGTVIEAAARSGVRVRIAGTGPYEAELRSLAVLLNAPVEFVGFRAGSDLWAEVDGARALILASEWYENAPMSVLEAFSRGKPLIGANIGGIPELIRESLTGWTFESGNAGSLAARLTEVYNLPDETIASMSPHTQSFVAGHFGPKAYYQSMTDLYRSLADLRPKQRS